MVTKNATRLLEGFVVLGNVSEVAHRSKRRPYGLKRPAALYEAVAPPRQPKPGRRPGRPGPAPPGSAGGPGEIAALVHTPLVASPPPDCAAEPRVRRSGQLD
jgi:hypothetical protein